MNRTSQPGWLCSCGQKELWRASGRRAWPLGAAFDRYELVIELAADYQRLRNNDHCSLALMRLLPELWHNTDSVRMQLLEILDTWVDQPEVALEQIDRLTSESRLIAGFLVGRLESMSRHNEDDDEDAQSARARVIGQFIETCDWDAYQLLHFCLRTGIRIEEIHSVLVSNAEYHDLAISAAPSYLAEDLAVKCVLAGCRAFWS